MNHWRDFLLGAACAVAAVAAFQGFVRPQPAAALGPEGASQPFLLETATGKYGGPLCFVLDTSTKVLCVYEAEGGTTATRGLTWVGARKIEWDVNYTSLNDKSELSYSEQKQQFLDAQAKRVTGASAPDESTDKH